MVAALEKAEADRVAEIHQGFLDGRQLEKVEIAKIMLEDGDSIERITRITGLSADDIKSL